MSSSRGEDAIDQDFALHCSIADACGNPQFRRLGTSRAPHHSTSDHIRRPRATQARLQQNIPEEHRDIVLAIRRGAVAQARAAMRRHLLNSRKRYQAFAGKLGNTSDTAEGR